MLGFPTTPSKREYDFCIDNSIHLLYCAVYRAILFALAETKTVEYTLINHKRERHSHKPVIHNLRIHQAEKRNMAKVNRVQATQILVLVTCSMFLISYSVPSGTFLTAQPEANWKEYPMHISPFAGSSTPQGYSPAQIRTAYNLPSSGGIGTTIAIIDSFDTPNILTYFNTFSSQYGLPDNSTGTFIVYKMPGTNVPPPSDIGWQLEACLDVEWAHAIAPNATILLVEAVY